MFEEKRQKMMSLCRRYIKEIFRSKGESEPRVHAVHRLGAGTQYLVFCGWRVGRKEQEVLFLLTVNGETVERCSKLAPVPEYEEVL